MEFIFTDGRNLDFIKLCRLLDDYLNKIAGGENNRCEYIKYNTLEDINDVVLAYEKDIPIGCASFKFYNEKTAEVKRFFVKKDYRGKGISKRLMKLLEDRAREKGYKKFILETGEALTEAMALYYKVGFKVIENYGEYKCMPKSICMEKRL